MQQQIVITVETGTDDPETSAKIMKLIHRELTDEGISDDLFDQIDALINPGEDDDTDWLEHFNFTVQDA